MSKNYFILIFLIFTAGCASVPTNDIAIETKTAKFVKFSNFKTYTWLWSATVINDSKGQWAPPAFDVDAEIKFLLNREMRSRGLTENTGAPDLVVAFAAGVNLDELGLNFPPDITIDIPVNTQHGRLVIVLIKKSSDQVIWVGVADAGLQDNADVNIAKARLDYAVTQMLKKLPK
jgi:Domain of unknown function (DUF4136)